MIDFHIHSNYSDGSETPEHIVLEAEKNGLKAISLTDHDSIDGLEEANVVADKANVLLLNGIEVSVAYDDNRLLHILGLGINTEKDEFLQIYHEFRQTKENQMDYVLHELKKQGVRVDLNVAKKYVTGGKFDRQCLAKYIFHEGVEDSMPHAWHRHLDKIPYIKGELLELEAALEMIDGGDGVSILAHYHKNIGLMGYSHEEKYKRLKRLNDMGLDGMELYYPDFTREQKKEVRYFVSQLGMVIGGGTDFHGKNRPEIKMGVGEGDYFVPDEVYYSVKDRLLEKELNFDIA